MDSLITYRIFLHVWIFDSQIKHMSEAGLLYQVISDFCTDRGDFSPEKISAVDMGYVFENLVRRFSESYNEEAGAHFYKS